MEKIMSNDLAMLDIGLPAHLKTMELDDTTKALMGSGGGGSKRISIEGGVWRLLVNGKEIAQKEERNLNVVIVAASSKVSRTYYEGVYKKGVTSTPDCWSPNGDYPDSTAKHPQAKSCATCPQNVKGSGQGDGRACRFSQRIAVVLDNDIGGDVFQLVLPSTSIFGEGESGKWPLQMYAKMIGAKSCPITAVVTEMRFDTASSTPKITFKPVRFLEADEIGTAISQGKSPEAIKAITMTVAAEKTDAPKLEAPKLADPEEVTKVEKEAETLEPTKRASKKEEPTPKKDLGKILSDWDDEA
jgi:hypothetical protein